jgi:hypothetical protein
VLGISHETVRRDSGVTKVTNTSESQLDRVTNVTEGDDDYPEVPGEYVDPDTGRSRTFPSNDGKVESFGSTDEKVALMGATPSGQMSGSVETRDEVASTVGKTRDIVARTTYP